jgi:hypothetical protein
MTILFNFAILSVDRHCLPGDPDQPYPARRELCVQRTNLTKRQTSHEMRLSPVTVASHVTFVFFVFLSH